jgi:drug/metabolite transporter (DMT)-like permease
MFTLQYSAVQKLPTHLTGALYFLYPVVAFVVDAVALDHRLQPMQLFGAAAILLAAAGMTLRRRTLQSGRAQENRRPQQSEESARRRL